MLDCEREIVTIGSADGCVVVIVAKERVGDVCEAEPIPDDNGMLGVPWVEVMVDAATR